MLNKDFDEKRFNVEYSQLFPVIFRVAFRVTGDMGIAEDLCHEAFIKYFERHEPLPDINQAKYWLIRVVKNMSLNHESGNHGNGTPFPSWRRSLPSTPSRRRSGS